MHPPARTRFALALAALGGALLGFGAVDEKTRRVDALFERWDRGDSPGCSLGIVRDGELIYERGYGMANLEHDIPIGPETVFRIASVSKQFTAMSLLLLERDGALSLDDDIRKYLPEMPDYGKPISIRNLVQHSSGVREYTEVMYLRGVADEDTYIEQEVVDLLARQRSLNFAPGERYLYSNSGYVLMAVIVERVSGKTLRQFTEERIFGPLGMQSTLFRDDHNEIVDHRATGYAPLESGGFRLSQSNYDLVGDGSVFTTVRDLHRWDQNFYGHEVGGADVVAAQHDQLVLNDGRQMPYAAGLEIGEYGGLRFVAHSGSWVGFRAQLLRFPEQRFSVICLCNEETANPTALALRIADVYLADRFASEPVTPAVASAGSPAAAPGAELSARAGVYRERLTRGIATVTATNSTLRVDRGWGGSEFAPVGRDAFRSAGADVSFPADLVFSRADGAEPARFQLREFGEVPLDFERIEPVSPTERELREYTGVYHSEEADVTHRVVLEDGQLYLRHHRSPETALEPTEKDHFTRGSMRVEFDRDSEDRVSGYGVWFDWAWNIRFARLEDRL